MFPMLRVLVILASGIALSCSDGSHAQADADPGFRRFTGKPTAALVKRQEIAVLVDALAVGQIESLDVEVGAGIAKFRPIREKATAEELLALVGHESPVVRGYMGRHLAKRGPVPVEAFTA